MSQAQPKATRYIHLRANSFGHVRATVKNPFDTNPFGGITIGYVQEQDKVSYAFARVHPSDRYNKTIGRKLVDERLTAGATKSLTFEELLQNQGIKGVLSQDVLTKLTLNDLHWKAINDAVTEAAQDTIGDIQAAVAQTWKRS